MICVVLLLTPILLTNLVNCRGTSEKLCNSKWNLDFWPVGPNFIPSTAENQLEFWQAATFDPVTIDRELGWVKSLGMNSVRVFLHYLPWTQDKDVFLNRLEQFLSMTAKYNIKTMFVLFDDCWNPQPQPGHQQPPIPHVHNSRWVQCPGNEGLLNTDLQDTILKDYVQGIMAHFKNDNRIFMWDLYNEPGNTNGKRYPSELHNKTACTNVLLEKVFDWANGINATQPVTSCIWQDVNESDPLQRIQLAQSDVISFHMYSSLEPFQAKYNTLLKFKKPLICTEYMARPIGSTFESIMPFAKEKQLGIMNWGFVNGKTQTIYPWDSWDHHYDKPPKIWFHDILWANGTGWSKTEVTFIKNILGV